MATASSSPGSSAPSPDPDRSLSLTPAYRQISDRLRDSVQAGRLAPGTVLLEGPLAALFGASRAPVRQALDLLSDEGLLSRFPGRGLVVGPSGSAPRREPLDPAHLGAAPLRITRAWGWQHLYADIERTLTLCCVLGSFELNEAELAAHHAIGRSIARDVLIRIEAAGLITKDGRARWLTVPLDHQRVANLYALRRLLEPAAIADAATRTPPALLTDMLARLDAATDAYPHIAPEDLDTLERDLHITLLAEARNAELPAALRRTHCILISSKHLLTTPLPHGDPFLAEHHRVLLAVSNGAADAAGAALLEHLQAAEAKVQTRLEQTRRLVEVPEVSYLKARALPLTRWGRAPPDPHPFGTGPK